MPEFDWIDFRAVKASFACRGVSSAVMVGGTARDVHAAQEHDAVEAPRALQAARLGQTAPARTAPSGRHPRPFRMLARRGVIEPSIL